MRERAWRGQAPRDRLIGHQRCNKLAVTGLASIGLSDMAQHLHPGRLDVQLLGDLLADRRQFGPALAAPALALVDLVDDIDPGGRLRQPTPSAFGAPMGRHRHGAEEIRLLDIDIIATRSRRLGLVKGQRQLVVREALAPRTEVLVAGEPDLLQELVDEQGLLIELPLLLEDQLTELGDTRRQLCRGVLYLVVAVPLVHLQYPVIW